MATRSGGAAAGAGGEYVYLTEAYGRLAGFLAGGRRHRRIRRRHCRSAMIVPFYGSFAPGAASSTPWVQIPLPDHLTCRTRGSCHRDCVRRAHPHRGVGPARVSNALTILKVAALLGFIAVGS